MVFKDYYQILDISYTSIEKEIKEAYKKQALKLHPDKNKERDTTVQMQDINEAYVILRDKEARIRYDIEYQSYVHFEKEKEFSQNKEKKESQKEKTEETENTSEYKIKDDVLEKWIKNAQKQSVDLALQTIRDLKGVTKAASEGCFTGIVQIIIVIILIPLLVSLLKTCI
jgi:DnaJ-class molecular chaperone